MGEVRIFWNISSCPMDKINRNWHLLDSSNVNFGGPGAQVDPDIQLWKKSLKLPRGSPSHLTSSRTFLWPSVTSKTPGKDFKDIDKEPVKNVWSLWSLVGLGGSSYSLGCQGAMRTPRKKFSQSDFRIHLKEYGLFGAFLGSRTPQINIGESKRCHFLFILSMGQDGVWWILTHENSQWRNCESILQLLSLSCYKYTRGTD